LLANKRKASNFIIERIRTKRGERITSVGFFCDILLQ
jgi:hypothetical protein